MPDRTGRKLPEDLFWHNATLIQPVRVHFPPTLASPTCTMTVVRDNHCRNDRISGPDIAGKLSPASNARYDSMLITGPVDEA